jgi:hypothetical protein
MIKHDPVQLTQTERWELRQITKTPGLAVLVDRIMGGHLDFQYKAIHTIAIDDPERMTKLSAICAVSDAMKLNLELVKREIERNWNITSNAEVAQHKRIVEKQKNARRKKNA